MASSIRKEMSWKPTVQFTDALGMPDTVVTNGQEQRRLCRYSHSQSKSPEDTLLSLGHCNIDHEWKGPGATLGLRHSWTWVPLVLLPDRDRHRLLLCMSALKLGWLILPTMSYGVFVKKPGRKKEYTSIVYQLGFNQKKQEERHLNTYIWVFVWVYLLQYRIGWVNPSLQANGQDGKIQRIQERENYHSSCGLQSLNFKDLLFF